MLLCHVSLPQALTTGECPPEKNTHKKKRGPRGKSPFSKKPKKKKKGQEAKAQSARSPPPKKKHDFPSMNSVACFCTAVAEQRLTAVISLLLFSEVFVHSGPLPNWCFSQRPPCWRPTCFYHVEARTELFPEKECWKKHTHTHARTEMLFFAERLMQKTGICQWMQGVCQTYHCNTTSMFS